MLSFYFHFLQRMLSHALCYLKRALFKARKSWILKIFLGQLYWLKDAKRNALDLTEVRNQVHYRKFMRELVIDDRIQQVWHFDNFLPFFKKMSIRMWKYCGWKEKKKWWLEIDQNLKQSKNWLSFWFTWLYRG